MPAAALDFWFDFASTYSYPAAMRIGPLAHAAGVAIRYRPFLLGPIFKAQGWDNSPFNLYAAKGHYMWRDLERLCADLNIAFRKPDPFPQHSLLAARVATTLADDPALGDFCRAVFKTEFADGRAISDETVIANILTSLKLSAGEILAGARSEAVKARLRSETEDAQRRGIFGAPTFICADGELFWGNDRLEQALAWAKRL